MAYNINKSNGDLLVVVENETINNTVSQLTFIGKNYTGFGELTNENSLHLLENFASPLALKPQSEKTMIGQLWYNTDNGTLNVFNGADFVAITLETGTAEEYVLLNGSVPMTGPLSLITSAPTNDSHATSKIYVDDNIALQVPLDGSASMTGELILSADPTDPLGAATKQYAEQYADGLSGLPIDGSVAMTGELILSGDPLTELGSTTKRYVDDKVIGGEDY